MFAIVFSLLIFAQGDRARPPFSPASKPDYEQVKANPKPDLSDAARVAAAELVLTSALARRGHSGDRSYLQGCDLFDLSATYDEANRDLIDASATWEEYAAYWHAAFPNHDYARRVFEGAPEQVAKARAEADQQARGALGEPLPDGALGSAVVKLRSANQCAVDLPNSEWLEQTQAWRVFQTSNDTEVLNGLYVLAMHADNRPQLQTRFGQIYEERRPSFGSPIEPGLRLIDRAQINLGQPQPYATAVLCEDGRPVFAGTVELETANARRIAAGLPPQDLQQKALSGFCGQSRSLDAPTKDVR